MSLPPYTVRVSFELDLTDFPGVRPDDKENLSAALQNLGSWLGNLQQYYGTEAFEWSSKKEPMSEEMYEHLMRHSNLAKQIFNNYRIEGTLANGTEFDFTHKEPGYQESLTYSNEPEPVREDKVESKAPSMADIPDDADIEWWLNDQTSQMDEQSRANILDVDTPDGMSRFGFFVGMGIRNYYGLWQNNGLTRWFNTTLGVYHADDMSGILLEALWHRIHDKPYDPAPLVERYRKHWESSGCNMKGEKINAQA